LDEPGERADAVAELLRRGEALYAPALFEALGVMTADELVVAVPAAVEHPEAFAAFFADAMTESDPPLRWAAILYLMDRGHPVPDTALDELPAATAMAGSLADRLRLVMGAGVYGGTDPLDLT
ncbi:MAG: hypothetical protein KC620_22315, partial [Myxococcales bacterium]|nr:hypothetical protein [Myxococcales bacterium]